MKVILGSSSVNRRAVFRELFPDYYIDDDTNFLSPDIDEKSIRSENSREMVQAIASAKLDKIIQLLKEKNEEEMSKDEIIVVITSDQVVLCNEQMREKPESASEARKFLRSYLVEGFPALCLNGIVVQNLSTGKRISKVQETRVKFLEGLGDEEQIIDGLIDSGIVYGMSGGFTIDPLKDRVDYIKGGVDGIKGFPALFVREMIKSVTDVPMDLPPINRITHIVFDMDGLLLDTESMYSTAQQTILDRFGKKFDYQVKRSMMGKKSLDGARALIEYYNLQNEYSPEKFVKDREEILVSMFPEASLLPGVQRLLEHLHSHDIPMAIATGSDERYFNLKTTKHKELFNKVFKHVITADQVSKSKPDPESFIKAAEKFPNYDKQTSKVLVFEDSPLGVKAALAAGFDVIMVEADYNKDSDVVPTQKILSLLHFRPDFYGLPPFE